MRFGCKRPVHGIKIKFTFNIFFCLKVKLFLIKKSVTNFFGTVYSCANKKKMCSSKTAETKTYCCNKDNCNNAMGNARPNNFVIVFSLVILSSYLTFV